MHRMIPEGRREGTPATANLRTALWVPKWPFARLGVLLLVAVAATILLPLATAQNPPTAASQTVAAETLVILDPGHGGADAGARDAGGAMLEKNLTLELALQLGKLLQSDPAIAVVYTRNSDVAIEPARRAEIANYAQGTLLLSLHAGTSQNPAAAGARVYFFGESPLPDVPSGRSEISPPSPKVKTSASTRADSLRLTPWGQAHAGHDSASNDLASKLQAELNSLYQSQYQVQALPIYLLKCVSMSSVLVEVGYLSSAADVRQLQFDEFRGQLSQALKTGILNYLEQARRLNLREH